MSLPASQLKRADIIIECEQGEFFTLSNGRPWFRCRVEVAQFEENHRNMLTMGELLKARMFSSTEYAMSMRKRMMDWRQSEHPDGSRRLGGGAVPAGVMPGVAPSPVSPHKFPCQDPYCDPCNEAIKRLFRDIGLLPSGKPAPGTDLTDEPFSGRLKVPTRYRRDESDR